jgi:16S rRNA (guanine1207-N2)-methyltransferase
MDPEPEAPRGAEHYFSEAPRARSLRREFRFLYRGEILSFVTDRSVFASHGLDPGTALLIEATDPRPTDRVLDLGCGWGAVGVAAARRAPQGHVVLTDVNRRAVQLARSNLERNRVRNADVRAGSLFEPVAAETFDLILTNPPYHAGRPLLHRLLTEAPAHLAPGGRLLIVGKGSQGIQYYHRWMEARWPAIVEVRARGSGYRVLEARRAESAPPTQL